MIKSRSDYLEYIRLEKSLYYTDKSWFRIMCEKITKESCMQIWKFQKWLRRAEYYHNTRFNPLHAIYFLVCMRMKNYYGIQLGISISLNTFDKGLKIDHYGNIVINGMCHIGKNCRLHGNNCVGVKGTERVSEFPELGDNCDLGFGSVVIGNVKLGNNIVIGANSVVTKSCMEDGAVLIGAPARRKK